MHDEYSPKKQRAHKPSRKGAKAVANRNTVRDCEYGDVLRLQDGRVCVLTSWLAGAPFGRYIDEATGKEGEFVELPADIRCVRLRGQR